MRRFLPAVTFALAFRVRRVGAFRAPRGAVGELSNGAVPGTPSGQPTLDASRSQKSETLKKPVQLEKIGPQENPERTTHARDSGG
jgi:hypothetical protein